MGWFDGNRSSGYFSKREPLDMELGAPIEIMPGNPRKAYESGPNTGFRADRFAQDPRVTDGLLSMIRNGIREANMYASGRDRSEYIRLMDRLSTHLKNAYGFTRDQIIDLYKDASSTTFDNSSAAPYMRASTDVVRDKTYPRSENYPKNSSWFDGFPKDAPKNSSWFDGFPKDAPNNSSWFDGFPKSASDYVDAGVNAVVNALPRAKSPSWFDGFPKSAPDYADASVNSVLDALARERP